MSDSRLNDNAYRVVFSDRINNFTNRTDWSNVTLVFARNERMSELFLQLISQTTDNFVAHVGENLYLRYARNVISY